MTRVRSARALDVVCGFPTGHVIPRRVVALVIKLQCFIRTVGLATGGPARGGWHHGAKAERSQHHNESNLLLCLQCNSPFD